MESLIQYIMEAKIKDEISAAKKIMKGNFLCNPADYSCAFTWKDDDFIEDSETMINNIKSSRHFKDTIEAF